MNWLAHALLSEPDAEFRLGNLLADLVKGRDRAKMPPGFLRGVRCHQAIDVFTDAHPVVARSRARLPEEHGRCAGILVDVFYDHVLARNWGRFADVPLEDFTAGVYASARSLSLPLPADVREALGRMADADLLGSYREAAGIEAALRRLSARLTRRTGRPFALERAVPYLVAEYAAFEGDFLEFFPELSDHVRRLTALTR